MAAALASVVKCCCIWSPYPQGRRNPHFSAWLPSQDSQPYSFPAKDFLKWKLGFGRFGMRDESTLINLSNWEKRKSLVCAASQGAEKAFQSTLEMDRLIDKLRVTDEQQLSKIVAENLLAFDSSFWMRLATRADLCESEDDKKDYEELASSVMSIVDRFVQKTKEKIESATDVLKGIIRPITEVDGEIVWPPRDPQDIILMKDELVQREQEGKLDEGFLSEVNAQLRQVADGQVIKAEELLESVIEANEEDWNGLLMNGLTFGGGVITPEELNAVIDKRVERTLIRTESGSYDQRILTEYLRGIQSRTQDLIQAFQNQQPS